MEDQFLHVIGMYLQPISTPKGKVSSTLACLGKMD